MGYKREKFDMVLITVLRVMVLTNRFYLSVNYEHSLTLLDY